MIARQGWARRFYRVGYAIALVLVFAANFVGWPMLIWMLGTR